MVENVSSYHSVKIPIACFPTPTHFISDFLFTVISWLFQIFFEEFQFVTKSSFFIISYSFLAKI